MENWITEIRGGTRYLFDVNNKREREDNLMSIARGLRQSEEAHQKRIQLIEAAPKLLEGLQWFIDNYEPEKAYHKNHFDNAKSAISKAKEL